LNIVTSRMKKIITRRKRNKETPTKEGIDKKEDWIVVDGLLLPNIQGEFKNKKVVGFLRPLSL